MQLLNSWFQVEDRTQWLDVIDLWNAHTIVDTVIRIAGIARLTTYADDSTIRKHCARRPRTAEAPYRVSRYSPGIFSRFIKSSSVPRALSFRTNLELPERFFHDRRISRSTRVGVSAGEILLKSDWEHRSCYLYMVTRGQEMGVSPSGNVALFEGTRTVVVGHLWVYDGAKSCCR